MWISLFPGIIQRWGILPREKVHLETLDQFKDSLLPPAPWPPPAVSTMASACRQHHGPRLPSAPWPPPAVSTMAPACRQHHGLRLPSAPWPPPAVSTMAPACRQHHGLRQPPASSWPLHVHRQPPIDLLARMETVSRIIQDKTTVLLYDTILWYRMSCNIFRWAPSTSSV